MPGSAWRVLLIISLAAPAIARAQGSASAGIPPLEPGKSVRVRLPSLSTVTGRFTAITDGRLGIETEAGRTESIPVEQIKELAVRGRHTKAGAIIGGIAGAAFGAFVAIVADALCETESCNGIEPYAIAIPAFGAGGALVGAAVGSAFPKWKRVYP